MPLAKPPTNTYWTIRHNFNGELWPRLWPTEADAWKMLEKETGFTKAEVAAKCNWSMVQVKLSLVAEVVHEIQPQVIRVDTPVRTIPDELHQFGNVLDASTYALPSGVYFLYLKGALQYIGQSAEPSNRLVNHRKAGKVFDRVFLLPVPSFMLARVEGAMIRKFRPPLNIVIAQMGGESDDETSAWLSKPLLEVCDE
jgi:hypothetical protein